MPRLNPALIDALVNELPRRVSLLVLGKTAQVTETIMTTELKAVLAAHPLTVDDTAINGNGGQDE